MHGSTEKEGIGFTLAVKGGSMVENTRISPVFQWAAGLIGVFVFFGAFFPEALGFAFQALQGQIVRSFGWLYIFSTSAFILFVVFVACSRFGRLRLGPEDARPEFGRLTWFSMLFSAGMGIGLLFFSVAEPMMHRAHPPPPFASAEGAELSRHAMGVTFFHWGLHPWAVYALVGLGLAYFGYRKGQPLCMRSLFRPLLGDRMDGPLGVAIDVLTIVSTLFGVATSLGLGAMQINSGLHHVFSIGEGPG